MEKDTGKTEDGTVDVTKLIDGKNKMRDKIKDEKYFFEKIDREKKRIIMLENAFELTISKSRDSDESLRNGYTILSGEYSKIINMFFSYGEDIESIREWYIKCLCYFSKVWHRYYGYFELIKVLSLGVLFEVDVVEISELKDRIIAENFDDFLVNVLIKRIDSSWMKSGSSFEFPNLYDYLKTVLESDESQTCDMLKEYLEKKWYNIHKECAWYNSHKSDRDLYYGYWSFEAGAIAKILKVDDMALKDVSYYPYDLVHYK